MKVNKSTQLSKTKLHVSVSQTSLGLVPTAQDFGEVVDEKEIWKQCRSEIANAINIDITRIQSQLLADSTKGCKGLISTDANDMSYLEGKKITPLVKWFVCGTTQYWLGFRLCFSSAPGSAKSHVNTMSLLIARSFPGAELEGLLRAEWDYWLQEPGKPPPKKIHAQPHWHIYRSQTDTEFAKLLAAEEASNKPLTEFSSESVQGITLAETEGGASYDSPPIEEFHFAMCAHWNRSNQIIQWPLAQADIRHWIRYCLKYIRSELET